MPNPSTLLDTAFGAQPWIADAACRDRPDIDFFTGDDTRDDPGPALGVCRSCLVTETCLAYAISLGASTVGVWGNTTGPQREELRRQLRGATVAA